jgi:hypothetical protein
MKSCVLLLLMLSSGVAIAPEEGLRAWTVKDSLAVRYFVADPTLPITSGWPSAN